MKILILNNNFCKILGDLSNNLIEQIDAATSYSVVGAEFTNIYKQGKWDGVKRFFSKNTFIFPLGLLHRVLEIFKNNNIDITILDKRKKPNLGQELTLNDFKFFDWQEEIIKIALKETRGIIKASTGSGKTEIMFGIIAKLNVPTIVLTHKKDLMYQLANRLKSRLNIDPGIIGDSKVNYNPKITFAMLQTLAYNLKIAKTKDEYYEDDQTKLTSNMLNTILTTPYCVFIDEVHIIPARTYFNVQKKFINSYYKYGLSATPYRTDGHDMMLEAAIGPRICDISTEFLINKGFLSKPTIYFINFKHPRVPKHYNYFDVYNQQIVNNVNRNSIILSIIDKFIKKGHSILVSVTKIEHGQILSEALNNLNIKNEFVNGELSTKQRNNILSLITKKELLVVVTTNIFNIGVDIPTLDIVINSKAQDSPIDFIQLIGRALRKTATKNKCLIIDFYDYGCKYLKSHSDNRVNIIKMEGGFTIKYIDAEKILAGSPHILKSGTGLCSNFSSSLSEVTSL